MKTQTFEVKAGEKCKIDNGWCGTTVEGPAIVVVLKEDKNVVIAHSETFDVNQLSDVVGSEVKKALSQTPGLL